MTSPRPHLAALLATIAALAATAAPASALSGATNANVSAYPFSAVVGGQCGGTLVAPDRVLTAARCVANLQNSEATVAIGATSYDPDAGPPALTVAAKGIALDPRFTVTFPFGGRSVFAPLAVPHAVPIDDVGLVILAHPVTTIAPVPIATPADAAALEQPGHATTVLGYGETTFLPLQSTGASAPAIPALQAATLSLIDAPTCQTAYPGAIGATDLCVADQTADVTPIQACTGDAGGPVLAAGPTGPVQIGISSWGAAVKAKNDPCGRMRLPDVAARVSQAAAFITSAHPVLAPRATAPAKLTGTGTLTCRAPRFSGSPARLSYRWFYAGRAHDSIGSAALADDLAPSELGVTPVARATARTLAVRHLSRRVACAATASNASGSWTVYSKQSAKA